MKKQKTHTINRRKLIGNTAKIAATLFKFKKITKSTKK